VGVWRREEEDGVNSSKLIYQRHNSDCAIAALAMYLGKSYDELKHHYTRTERRHAGASIEKTLNVADSYKTYFGVFYGNEFDRTRPALVIVPSRNHVPDGKHMIYWDGQRVYDPSPIRPYTELPDEVEYALQEDAERAAEIA
jgi:hypothetical protein